MHTVAVSHLDLFLVLLGVGAAGGILSGMLGVGGGIIFVPALYFTMRAFFPGAFHVMHVAVATSLSLVMATSASSTYWHNRRGAVDFSLLKAWALPMVCGVTLGTFLASYVESAFLKDFFAAITVLIAIYIMLGRDPAEDAPLQPHRIPPGMQKVLAGAIGTVASMLGIGGAML
ncbi:MAG: sulfite exporter TauE/SafE family protein, partial [Alphaproteobacteria bacterium]|nr:sulfite exporter TauE/SafE family protein [Alphaproteobacteria bacterium]